MGAFRPSNLAPSQRIAKSPVPPRIRGICSTTPAAWQGLLRWLPTEDGNIPKNEKKEKARKGGLD